MNYPKISGRYIFRKVYRLCILMIAGACSVFEYHPYETMLDDSEKNLNSRAIKTIQENVSDPDTLTIIAIGDSQRFYDELKDFVKSANQQKADFVILNGDISDFGLKDEYQWVDEIMQTLNKPYIGVIGNHDLSGNGEKIYTKMYGPLNTSFIVNGFKFILLNTNSREYAFSSSVPDLNWLNAELNTHDFHRAIVVSHVPPYDSDFNPDLEVSYANTLSQSGRVAMSLHAHRHTFEYGQPYQDGTDYLVATSMNERMYLVIRLYGHQYTFTKIFY